MKTLFRLPLQAHNLHALAGFYTDGVSLTAMHGLSQRLAADASLPLEGFALTVAHYESTLRHQVKTGMDLMPRAKQTESASATAYRYGQLHGALYLLVGEDLAGEDLAAVREELANTLMRSRIQGAPVIDFIEPTDVFAARLRTEEDALRWALEQEKPLTQFYFSAHLSVPLDGPALLEHFAQKLATPASVMLCNGYHVFGTATAVAGDEQLLAEPCYTLGLARPTYLLKKTPEELPLLAERFFFSFDQDLYNTSGGQQLVIR